MLSKKIELGKRDYLKRYSKRPSSKPFEQPYDAVMERVDLVHEHAKVIHQRWHHGWQLGWNATYVAVGELPDGRWFADRTGRGASRRDKRQGACAYTGPHAEHYARATARRWMRALGGTWEEVARIS